MKRSVAVVVALLVAATVCPAAFAAEKPGLELVGIQVVKPDPGRKHFGIVQGLRAGTSLWLRLTRPDKHFICLDEKASTLDAYADDKGTDLKPTAQRTYWGKPIRGQVPDASHCVLEFQSSKIPAAGARTLAVKANVVMTCGVGEKSAEQKGVALKAGSPTTVGPVPMKVEKIRPSGWGKVKMTVELSGEKDEEMIKEVVFVGPDGEVVPSRKVGSSRSRIGTKVNWRRSYGLHQKLETATVRIIYFERVETLAVPVEVTAGVGL